MISSFRTGDFQNTGQALSAHWYIHRGLELLGIQGYTAIREYQNNTMKKGFCYEEETDPFYGISRKHAEINTEKLSLSTGPFYYTLLRISFFRRIYILILSTTHRKSI